MKAQGIDGLALLSRHVTGDWGDLGEEATRQGIDPHRPATDPVMHTLLTGIVCMGVSSLQRRRSCLTFHRHRA